MKTTRMACRGREAIPSANTLYSQIDDSLKIICNIINSKQKAGLFRTIANKLKKII